MKILFKKLGIAILSGILFSLSMVATYAVQTGVGFDEVVGDLKLSSAGALQTGTTASNTALLQAYDVDGAVYATFATLTANNIPTFDLASGTTIGSQSILNASSIGSSVQAYDADLTDIAALTPTLNNVLKGDGTHWTSGAITVSSPFATASNVTSNSPGTLATDDFVFGSASLLDDGDSNHDKRMFFDKSKAAFMAGEEQSTSADSIGSNAVIFGRENTASGTGAVAFGDTNTVSGQYAFAQGNGNSITRRSSFGLGDGNQNSSFDYQLLTGWNVNANTVPNSLLQGSETAYGARDVNLSRLALGLATTDATQTNMKHVKGAAAFDTYLKLNVANSMYGFHGNIWAFQKSGAGGAIGDTAMYTIDGILYRDASNTTTLKYSNVTVNYEGNAAWDCALAADDANEALAVKVTGEANENIIWGGWVELMWLDN